MKEQYRGISTTRRRFIAANIGALIGGTLSQTVAQPPLTQWYNTMVMPEQLPISENEALGTLHSPYYTTTLKEARTIAPAKEEEIKTLLDAIDQQGLAQVGQFASEKFPGVHIPYTTVSVNTLAEQALGVPHREVSDETVYHVVLCGFAMPPAGHPFTAWDVATDRAINATANVAGPIMRDENPPNVVVVSIGSPNGLGGTVSQEWVDTLGKEKFAPYGKAYAELLTHLLSLQETTEGSKQRTRIILNGTSLGSYTAVETAKQLKAANARVQLLLDNPQGQRDNALLNTMQTWAGFAVETGRNMRSENGQLIGQEEKQFLPRYEGHIRAKGMVVGNDPEQQSLKQKALLQDVLHAGTPLDSTIDQRTYFRRGIADPTTFSLERVRKTKELVAAGKNAIIGRGKLLPQTEEQIKAQQKSATAILEFPINATHAINRFQIGRWASAIDFAAKAR